MRVPFLVIVLAAVLVMPLQASAAIVSGSDAMNARFIADATRYANAGMAEETVASLATKWSMEPNAVVGAIVRTWQRLKSAGIRGDMKASRGYVPVNTQGYVATPKQVASGVGALLLGSALVYGGEVLTQKMFGSTSFYHADGTPHSMGYIGLDGLWSQADGQPIYMHQSEGWFAGEETDSEIAWIWGAIPEYGGVVLQPDWSTYGGVNHTVSYQGVTFTAPQAGAFGALTAAMPVTFLGVINGNRWYQITVAGTTRRWWTLGVDAPGTGILTQNSGAEWVAFANAALAPGWDSLVGTTPAQLAKSADPAMVPGQTPSDYSFNSPITEDSTIEDVLAAYTVPNVVPYAPTLTPATGIPESSAEATTSVGFLSQFWTKAGLFVQNLTVTSPSVYSERVTPVLAEMKLDGAQRWPFAGGAVLAAVAAPLSTPGGGGDPIEWYVDVTPTQLTGLQTGSVGVWIRPLTWVAPFAPYRWFMVGCVALCTITVLWSMLRPSVAV